ncbi:hypothetical protein R1sor_016590 [Riccia sorocarpa]|uniref:Uncharacterized protein n=1 Tax=Riccia sorocarpa TaxID=122646 RepID=A0ABD3HJK1_9MARC
MKIKTDGGADQLPYVGAPLLSNGKSLEHGKSHISLTMGLGERIENSKWLGSYHERVENAAGPNGGGLCKAKPPMGDAVVTGRLAASMLSKREMGAGPSSRERNTTATGVLHKPPGVPEIGQEKISTFGPGKRRDRAKASIAYLQILEDTLSRERRQREADSRRLDRDSQLSESSTLRQSGYSLSGRMQSSSGPEDTGGATPHNDNPSGEIGTEERNVREALAQLSCVERPSV